MLGFVQPSIGAEGEAERVAVSDGEHVAADAADLGVVRGNRAIEIEPEDLALIRRPVLRSHLRGGGQRLGVVGVAAVAAEVAALIADGEIELPIGAERQAAADVIGMGRQSGQDVERLDEHTRRLIVSIAPDRQTPSQRRPRRIVIGERHVDEVVSGAAQEVGMKREAEETILRERRVHFGNGRGHASRTVRGIDADDASAGALGDPELLVGSPGNLPRTLEP